MVNVFFRAVLEKVCRDNNVKLVKKKRRRVLGNNYSDVDSFVVSPLDLIWDSHIQYKMDIVTTLGPGQNSHNIKQLIDHGHL